MRAGTRRRWAMLGRIVAGGAAAGAAYGALAGLVGTAEPGSGALIGIVRGATIASLLGATEIFGMRARAGRALERAPFLVTLGLKGVLYGTIIVGAEGLNLGTRLVAGVAPRPFASPMAPLSVAFSFFVSFVFLFVLQMARLVGPRTLRDIVLGRYHRPRVEERFFLFVDLAGSTPLAERLGPTAVHRFLARVFRLAADPVDDEEGEIHQYVGDEVVVTWPVTPGRDGARPIACFLALETALARAAADFQRDFGAVPHVRGALHAGPVIAGEVGETKREIVFHGDTMNTASRLEQLARELGRRLLVSEDAVARLPGAGRYALEDLGLQSLRGRAAPVRVFAVEAKAEGLRD